MLIATELKTGIALTGSFDQSTLDAWAGSFANVDFFKAHGEPNIELSEYAQSELRRIAVRKEIDSAAQPLTREGVIADVAATMVVGIASVIKSLNEGKDLAGVKAALQPLVPMAEAVLGNLATAQDLKDPEAAIKAGKVVFPYMVKGGSAKVMGDMASLANGVTSALIAAKKSA
jgi:hypothetical protein